MNSTFRLLAACSAMAMLAAGCGDSKNDTLQVAAQASSPAVAGASPPADRWLGKWIGPEATFLQIAGGKGKYELTIQNLDGPRTFQGRAVNKQIEFERDGLKETIHLTNGAETGMKWLSKKTDCLTVRVGEGYCRD